MSASIRVMHAGQIGMRLRADDSLFHSVEAVPPCSRLLPPPPPQPEVTVLPSGWAWVLWDLINEPTGEVRA